MGGTINTSEKFKTTVVNSFVEPPRLITDEPKEYYYLSYFKAYQGIDSWRSYVRDARNGLIGDTARFSFIIPATTLRYLVDPDSMNLDYVTFYLALDSANWSRSCMKAEKFVLMTLVGEFWLKNLFTLMLE